MPEIPVALSIAGSDSGGGAGAQADLLTFAACGVFGTTAITCLTAQNPRGVSGVHAAPGAFVREQAERVAEFFPLRAVKTGMLLNADIIGAVADFLNAHPEIPYILDPVMVATSGARLLDDHALAALREKLVPRAALVTPNLDEAAVLLGRTPSGSPLTQKDDALALAKKLGVPVLLKGGHASGAFALTDAFATPAGDTLILSAERRPDIDTHGSGCTLASAVAAHVARGLPMKEAVAAAHAYLQRAIAAAVTVDGNNYIAHLPEAEKNPPVEAAPAPAQANATASGPASANPPPLPAGSTFQQSATRGARILDKAITGILESATRPAARSGSASPADKDLRSRQTDEDATLRWLKLNAKVFGAAFFLQFFLFPLPGLVWVALFVFGFYSYKAMHRE